MPVDNVPKVPYLYIQGLPEESRQQLYRDFEEIQRALCPTGMVAAFAEDAPIGWLLCDGQSLKRQDYPQLFAYLGYRYGGSGDNFNLPQLKGRVIIHRDPADAAFDVLGEMGGSKTSTGGHTHTFWHGHSTNHVSTNHAHNVYARNQDTGWCNQNWNHWHPAHIGNMHWNGTQTHGHHDRGSVASEAPWEGANWAGTVPVNVDTRDTNHTHNFNHDHPSTNYQSESGWPGIHNHEHNTDSQDSGTTSGGSSDGPNGNMPPYTVLNVCIKT